ncbi:Rha family transcriptional regulator [Dysgonomonas alginatilytica]|nr:Rha family transcriptional regulator [Dysgonomonas alginatilytica]
MRIAEKFGKKHFHVTDAIKSLLNSHEKSCQCFVLSTYTNDSGKCNPMYIMNRDGFMILTMGFTGQKALDFKFEFIEAFNYMEEIIKGETFSRVEIVEANIKRRYLLRTELSEVNRSIERGMKRQREIKKELKKIDEQDFSQLQIFPRYADHELKVIFPNRRIS